MNTRIDRLEHHRTWLWTVMGLAFAAIASSFLFLLAQIDSRFDRADSKVEALSGKVTELREGVAAQGPLLAAIKEDLERMDAKSTDTKPSSKTGEN